MTEYQESLRILVCCRGSARENAVLNGYILRDWCERTLDAWAEERGGESTPTPARLVDGTYLVVVGSLPFVGVDRATARLAAAIHAYEELPPSVQATLPKVTTTAMRMTRHGATE